MGDFFNNAAGGVAGMFGGTPPGGSNPLPAAPVDPYDTGPFATTGGGTLPEPTPTVSPGAVKGGLMPTGKEFNPWSVLPAAVGGIGSIIGLAKNQGSATDKALKRQAASTQGLANVGNQQLNAYSTGQLTPTQQASVDRFKQENIAKWQQYLASAGIPQSSAMADISAKVNTDAQVYANQLLQQDFDNAFKSIGLNQGNLASLARQQALQDEQQRKAWADFMAAMGKLGTDIGPIFT